jgi:hypothetical protein
MELVILLAEKVGELLQKQHDVSLEADLAMVQPTTQGRIEAMAKE